MKEKPHKFWKVVLFGLGFVFMLISIYTIAKPTYFAQGLNWLFSNKDYEELNDEDVAIITEVYDSIQNFYVDDISKQLLLEGALKGMVNALEDPYSEYLNPAEAVNIDDSMEGSFHGIGVQMLSREGVITVVSPIEGTPASEAGIKPNDLILEADGVPLTGMDTNEVVQLIRGEIGTSVELLMSRNGEEFTLEIIRAEIPIITVVGELDEANPTIGHVQVTQFNTTTYDEMVESIEKLRQDGAEAFIFDFRYNPGGLLDVALSISNMFLEDGQIIMQMEESGANVSTYVADDQELGDLQVTEPYVLLINEGSASASEILAAAIKENTDAIIAGETSFGKGSVQTIINQSQYGELKLTFAKWLTPSGEWIHEKGIAPTQEIPSHPIEDSVLLNSEEKLKVGDSNLQVSSLITTLEVLDYDTNEATFFNDDVQAAVEAFQVDNQLETTGEVTGDTARLLNEAAQEYINENDIQYETALDLLKEIAKEADAA